MFDTLNPKLTAKFISPLLRKTKLVMDGVSHGSVKRQAMEFDLRKSTRATWKL